MFDIFKKKKEIATMVKNTVLPPKIATVEEIHAEFDSAEQRILDQCDAILAELKIPTETQIERKAKMLEELGFKNSETVKQAFVLKERTREIETKINLTKQQADLIRSYKVKYPLEKFITVDELERICNKYNLIHAPVKNYIKDIPEKNVLEMTNCKKLEYSDKALASYKLTSEDSRFQEFLNAIGKPDGIINEGEDIELLNKFSKNRSNYIHNPWGINDDTWTFVIWGGIGEIGTYSFKQLEKIDKSGLFIAAPPSHFNLDNLDKKSQYSYFNVEKYEVKDPVVFEYCKNNVCRIVTKWGTEDDKSYLDPALTNEIEN